MSSKQKNIIPLILSGGLLVLWFVASFFFGRNPWGSDLLKYRYWSAIKLQLKPYGLIWECFKKAVKSGIEDSLLKSKGQQSLAALPESIK